MTARHFFPTADKMRSMLAPVARDAETQLGSRASLFTITRVKRPDGTFGPAAPVAGAVGVPIKLSPVTRISEGEVVARRRVQEIFGVDIDIRMLGKLSRANAVEPGTVLTITEGDFLGQTFEVTAMVEVPLSDSYVLGLKDHGSVS